MSINFEGLEKMSPEGQKDRVLSEAYKKAKDIFEHDRIIIDPANFTDYSPESIQKDLEFVDRVEEQFKQEETQETAEAKRLATILEEIFADQIELNDWLGENSSTRKASRYDDIANGVDEIIEIHEDTSINYLALAIDVTYSGDGIRKKLTRIKNEITSGDLATVKYFESTDGSIRGRLSKVPRVIIGVDKERVLELAKLWIERDNKALSLHSTQLEILDEIKLQLEAYKKYAETMEDRSDIVRIYERQLALIEKIRSSESKMELRKKADLSYRQNDRVYLAIKQGAENFSS